MIFLNIGFPNFNDAILDNSIFSRHLNYSMVELKEKLRQNFSSLNHEQLAHYNEIVDSYNNQNQNHLYYIDGSGGTGKTFLYNTIVAKVRSENNIALSMASTGIASILLDGGQTAHTTLKLPLNPNSTSMCNFSVNSSMSDLIKKTQLFVWDEAPSMNLDFFETVDRTFQDIMKNNKPFGGKYKFY